MRIRSVTALLLAILVVCSSIALVGAWEKEDHELFALQAAIEEAEGPGANFYTFFNIKKGASPKEIAKAYRKRSMELHPDKNPDNPQAAKRFERLGLVNKILRDARRDRYDHFLSHGFPKWKNLQSGGGYFYERFRPGLGTAVVLVVLLSALIQYVVQHVTYRQNLSRFNKLRDSALVAAWGPRFRAVLYGAKDNVPNVAKERKVRVPLIGGPELEAPPSKADIDAGKVDWDEEEKKVRKAIMTATTAGSAAKPIDMLVQRIEEAPGYAIFVPDSESGDWSELREQDAAPAPSFSRTWPFAAARALLGKISGQKGAREEAEDEAEGEGYEVKNGDADASALAKNGGAKKRKGKKAK